MNLALANRPRLIQPGLPRFEPGVERYRIAGGGAVVLALFAGDRLEITDLEGRQRAEVAVFAPGGEEDAAALGLRAEGSALGINRLLAGSDGAARAVAALLKARGVPRAIAKAVDLFQHDSLPGETASAMAARDVIAIIHASGTAMGVEGELPPTDLVALVRRANPLVQETPPLPEPLAVLLRYERQWAPDPTGSDRVLVMAVFLGVATLGAGLVSLALQLGESTSGGRVRGFVLVALALLYIALFAVFVVWARGRLRGRPTTRSS